MENRNDWKRVNRPATPSRSGKYGGERRDFRDGNNNSRRQNSNNYNTGGNRRNDADNYGNRMEDPNFNYDRNEDSGVDSGYIDLDSAVDPIPGKKKRKRIVKEPIAGPQGSVTERTFKKVLPGQRPPVSSYQRPYEKPLYDKPLQRGPQKRKGPQKPPLLPKKKQRPIAPEYPDVVFEGPVRLNRFIANTGLCSRREADVHIKAGLIKVNGAVVTEMGKRVNPDDEVSYNDKALSNQRKIYLLLNKPKGFVTSVDEPNGKKVVMELVRSACKERIYPVGRLDKMTTGVLLFTNDGDLSLKLTHPSNRMRKVYQVTLDKPLAEEDLAKLSQGIELEDGAIKFDSIAYTDLENKTVAGVEIHSGRNRIVRRMFEAAGYKVMKLDRVYFAGLTRKGLKRGKWRFLSPEEVAFLKMMPS